MTSNAIGVPPTRPARCWPTPCAAILLLACALALTSCARGTRPTPEAIPPELLQLVVPLPPVAPDLTVPCPPVLPPAIDSSLAGLGQNHLATAALYHDCKDGKRRLVDAVRDRERLELQRIERARRALETRRDNGAGP